MNSMIPWIGGKKLLREKIIEQFPDEGIEKYVEVFGGAGWVLFGREQHAKIEIYNDANSDLVNLFRCAKYHAEELQREIRSLCITSREAFCDYRDQLSMRGLTDIQRAARFYLAVRMSFGANVQSFGCDSKNIYDTIDHIQNIQQRLKRVLIEHQSYEKIIPAQDGPGTLYYLDPPYHTTEKYYETAFLEEDHMQLRTILSTIKGRFVLSYNDDEFTRSLYHGYNIINVERGNNISKNSGKYKEIIIKNF